MREQVRPLIFGLPSAPDGYGHACRGEFEHWGLIDDCAGHDEGNAPNLWCDTILPLTLCPLLAKSRHLMILSTDVGFGGMFAELELIDS